ncbi:hypothetical protein KI387_015586, partial [Taxus chinensis]
MGSLIKRVVGVKGVDGNMPKELWDERMPLPGDILLGIAPGGAGVFDFVTRSLSWRKRGVSTTSSESCTEKWSRFAS